MAYDKHIDKTEEELCELREVYSSNEVDRFTDGLESGRINCEEKVIEFTNYIRNSDGLTQLEYSRLKRLLDEGFTDLAKPSGRRMEACARGQLLLLAPWEHHNEQLTIRRDQCLSLNAMAKEICNG